MKKAPFALEKYESRAKAKGRARTTAHGQLKVVVPCCCLSRCYSYPVKHNKNWHTVSSNYMIIYQ